MHPKRRTKLPAGKPKKAYAQLWKIVDGAVADAFAMHPNYLARGQSAKVVRTSINKRVVGVVLAFAEARGRTEITPADTGG